MSWLMSAPLIVLPNITSNNLLSLLAFLRVTMIGLDICHSLVYGDQFCSQNMSFTLIYELYNCHLPTWLLYLSHSEVHSTAKHDKKHPPVGPVATEAPPPRTSGRSRGKSWNRKRWPMLTDVKSLDISWPGGIAKSGLKQKRFFFLPLWCIHGNVGFHSSYSDQVSYVSWSLGFHPSDFSAGAGVRKQCQIWSGPGRKIVEKWAPRLKQWYKLDINSG